LCDKIIIDPLSIAPYSAKSFMGAGAMINSGWLLASGFWLLASS
jgi:hypothetical protein